MLAVDLPDLFGTVAPPPGTPQTAGPLDAVVKILNVGLNLIMIVAGLLTLVSFILAGYTYLTAGGEPKKIEEANKRILLTVIGLILVVSAPVLAGVVGMIVFGRWDAILRPEIETIGP